MKCKGKLIYDGNKHFANSQDVKKRINYILETKMNTEKIYKFIYVFIIMSTQIIAFAVAKVLLCSNMPLETCLPR